MILIWEIPDTGEQKEHAAKSIDIDQWWNDLEPVAKLAAFRIIWHDRSWF
jgi:hypothetical protein